MASTIIGAHAFEHFFSNAIPLLTTFIAADMGLGAIQVGIIVAVRSACGGLTSVTGGFLSDLFHHRVAWVLSISAFLSGIGLLLDGGVANVWAAAVRAGVRVFRRGAVASACSGTAGAEVPQPTSFVHIHAPVPRAASAMSWGPWPPASCCWARCSGRHRTA